MPKGIYGDHNWSKPTTEEFKEYYFGHSVEDTANHFGTSTSSIIRFAKKNNCQKPTGKGSRPMHKLHKIDKVPKEIRDKIFGDYSNGQMVNFLVKKYELNWKQVSDLLKKYYGVENPARRLSELTGDVRGEFLKRRRESHYEKYGTTKFEISDDTKKKISQTRTMPGKKEKFHKTYSEAQKRSIQNGNIPFSTAKQNRISKLNEAAFEYLKENGILCEKEKWIESYSYDLAYKNFLIELNPTITHNVSRPFSETRGSKNGKARIVPKYHYNKWRTAKNNGYELLSWFGWMDLKKFLDFFIKRANGFTERIYARNTVLKEITQEEANKFLEENHLLGACRGNFCNLGLFDQGDRLVQIMTFGYPRNTKKAEYELLRLASLGEVQVIGGASKLLKLFISKYNPKTILTYADNNFGSHKVYEQLGFTLLQDNSISATWHKPESRRKKKIFPGTGEIIKESSLLKIGADRFFRNTPGYFKVGLDRGDFIKRGGMIEYAKEYEAHKDDLNWWPGNDDIMLHQKFYKVYDCGYSTYLLTL